LLAQCILFSYPFFPLGFWEEFLTRHALGTLFTQGGVLWNPFVSEQWIVNGRWTVTGNWNSKTKMNSRGGGGDEQSSLDLYKWRIPGQRSRRE
jgi:hypothetical protein